MENEKFELMLDEAQANAALEKGMLYADAFVNKNYLINLDRYPLVELDPAEKSDEYIRLYQIERIVYDVDENANDKLISVYSAFFNIQAAGLLVIKSARNALSFYIGVRSVDNTSTAEAIFREAKYRLSPKRKFKRSWALSIKVVVLVQDKMLLRYLLFHLQEMKTKSVLCRVSKSSLIR